jgi:hypothetical protein
MEPLPYDAHVRARGRLLTLIMNRYRNWTVRPRDANEDLGAYLARVRAMACIALAQHSWQPGWGMVMAPTADRRRPRKRLSQSIPMASVHAIMCRMKRTS